jgi:glycosyltransferase involved in cell wall biosynthesis
VKVAFLTPCATRLAGGIFEIERRLAQSLAEIPDTTVRVFSPADEYAAADLPAWRPLVPQTFPYAGPAAFRYSPALRRAVLADDSDVAHLHALWMHTSLVARAWHRRGGRPYLTTLNGMLEPWALRNSAWKKRLASALFERDCLNRAACLQVNTEGELQSARDFGLKNPVCIIPNGIDLPERETRSAGRGTPPWAGRVEPGCQVLLYLGRIHPKKGLVNLLRGWARWEKAEGEKKKSENWILAIAGWEQGGHEAELKKLCGELNLPWSDLRPDTATSGLHTSHLIPHTSARVLFLGPQHGDAKADCYANCAAFILPSFSEGLPMVVLEAWSHARPVLMTPGCNLAVGYERNAAWRVETTPESIAQGLADLFRAPGSTLQALGENGRRLVGERYQWPAVARDLRAVYAWLLGSQPPPSCVVTS